MKRPLSGSAPWRTAVVDWFHRVRSERTFSSRSGGAAGLGPFGREERLELDRAAPRGPPGAIRSRSRRAACSDRRTCPRRSGTAATAPRTWSGAPGRSFFQSACSRRSSDAAFSQSRDSASSSARAHSASFFAWLRRPDFLALRQVFVSAREELVARVAEPLPDDARVGAGDRARGLPLRLELLHLLGGLDPVGGLGERFGALAQVELDLEVGFALDGARGEELARLRLDRIRGLAVAVPERLRLRARRFGRLLPALLDVVQLARRLLHVLGLVEVVLLAERLGLRDQLFLDGGVREPLPLVHLAQLVQLRRRARRAPPSAARRGTRARGAAASAASRSRCADRARPCRPPSA